MQSARYGGPDLSDRERVKRLLEATEGVPDERRTARFRCVLALTAPWGEEATVEGVVEGLLTRSPGGAGGFGYDPIFWIPEVGRTFAELSPGRKGAREPPRPGRGRRPPSPGALAFLQGRVVFSIIVRPLREWRNWQTRWT